MENQENNLHRNSFVFHRSYYDALQTLSIKNRLKMYDVLAKYALDHEEPKNLPKQVLGIFLMLKPNIDSSNKNYLRKLKRNTEKELSGLEQEIAEKVQLPKKENESLTNDEFEL